MTVIYRNNERKKQSFLASDYMKNLISNSESQGAKNACGNLYMILQILYLH
jgi:hypothetical protein